jgi:hypothetical protein
MTWTELNYFGFQVFTVVTTKSTVFSVVMPCSWVRAHDSGGTYCFFDLEDGANMFLQNRPVLSKLLSFQSRRLWIWLIQHNRAHC